MTSGEESPGLPDQSEAVPPGVPRWVKALGVVLALFVLLLAIRLTVGGEHSPGRHLGAGQAHYLLA